MADAAAAAVAIAAAAAADAQPASRRADLVVAKALVLLCLASLSVGFAAAGAVAVTFAACKDGDPCPVLHVLAATCIKALVVAGMLASVAPVLVVRAAMCDAGLREDLTISIVRHMQSPRPPMGSILREAVVQAILAALAFILLSGIGCMVVAGLSPAKGSRTDHRIGAMLIVVGQVGSAAISCFIIFPLMGLKLWRMKLGDAAVAESNV
uniref:Uncharacterized protein n=1 Tax=Setaria viridis TaxID=4556 RepID=A0A4V6Y875_SETVI|nr:hypothetical protein SEVIR_6G154700v2 [Setaria viridis]